MTNGKYPCAETKTSNEHVHDKVINLLDNDFPSFAIP